MSKFEVDVERLISLVGEGRGEASALGQNFR
jgi:hypothetical protein